MPKKTLLASAILAATIGSALANNFEIVNGTPAEPGKYPWFVSLGNDYRSSANEAKICGGTLIDPGWVLTSAHCIATVSLEYLTATIGRDRLSGSDGERIVVKRIIVHPDYDEQSAEADLALLELERPVSNPQIVTLAQPTLQPADDTRFIALGHGDQVSLRSYLAEAHPSAAVYRGTLDKMVTALLDQGYSFAQILSHMLRANGLDDPKLGIGYPELVAWLQSLGDTGASQGMSIEQLAEGLTAHGKTPIEAAYFIDRVVDAGSDELREVVLPLLDDPGLCLAPNLQPMTSNMVCAGYGSTMPITVAQGDSGGPLLYGMEPVQFAIITFASRCGRSYSGHIRLSGYLDWITGQVPGLRAERVFAYAQHVFGDVLKAAGNEHSFYAGAFAIRHYPASNTMVGSDGTEVYYHDGNQVYPVGLLTDWFEMARSAGF